MRPGHQRLHSCDSTAKKWESLNQDKGDGAGGGTHERHWLEGWGLGEGAWAEVLARGTGRVTRWKEIQRKRLLLGNMSSVLATLGWMCQWDIRGHLGI